jgi:hypothetical protein
MVAIERHFLSIWCIEIAVAVTCRHARDKQRDISLKSLGRRPAEMEREKARSTRAWHSVFSLVFARSTLFVSPDAFLRRLNLPHSVSFWPLYHKQFAESASIKALGTPHKNGYPPDVFFDAAPCP